MIETKVEGDAPGIERAAAWLRSSLREKVESAAEAQVGGRRAAARSWDGESAEAYQAFSKPVLRATDEHVPRIDRAAIALEDLAFKLKSHEQAMVDFRRRARGGGLTVTGTAIQAPPDAPGGVFAPGSPEETAHSEAVARVELYNRLSDEISIAQDNYSTWVHAEMPVAVADASEREELQKAKGIVGGLLPGFLVGWGQLSFQEGAKRVREERNRRARRTRRSGNPDWSTRKPDQKLTDADYKRMTKVLKFLDKFGKIGGPIGIGIDVVNGVVDGIETGDWWRAGLTTAAAVGTGIAVGAGLAALTAGAVATAPVWGTVLIAGGVAAATGVAAWAASEAVGWAYDHRGEAADWAGDRAEDVGDWAGDRWDAAADAIGDTWDAVTPW